MSRDEEPFILKPGVAEGQVKKIIGGAVDATPPTTIALPSSGSILAASSVGVWHISEGSFYGTSTTASRIRSSTDAVAWTDKAFETENNVIAVASNTVLRLVANAIQRSTDGAATFSTVYSVGVAIVASPVITFAVDGTSIYAAISISSGNAIQVVKSTDVGATWSVLQSSVAGCFGAPSIAASGSIIVIAQQFTGFPCAASLSVSTNSGSTFADADIKCDGTVDVAGSDRSYTYPVVGGSTIYVNCREGSGALNGILQTVNGTTWTLALDTTSLADTQTVHAPVLPFFNNVSYTLYHAIGTNQIYSGLTLIYTTSASSAIGRMIQKSGSIYFGQNNRAVHIIQ